MIYSHCKNILKLTQLFTLRCNEICSTPGIQTAVGGVKVRRTPVKKKESTQELKKDGKVVTETGCTNVLSKGLHIGKEAACDEATVINAKETESNVKGDDVQKETCKKEEHVVLDDFLIKNIITFPLHATIDETETIDAIEPKMKKFPSVTSILQETMPPEARKRLELWKQKMIEMMGHEKFFSYQNATLNRGSRFHSALKSYLLGEDMEKIRIHKEVEGCWNSVKSILPDISDVKVVESDIVHPHLQYKGIVDCVASYKNTPYVIEWKQSEKVKKDLSSTFDAPIQLTAYMGALSWCKKVDLPAPVTCGLVVVAYCDGTPAEVFQMDPDYCQSYWEQWLRRVQRFWAVRSTNLKHPAS